MENLRAGGGDLVSHHSVRRSSDVVVRGRRAARPDSRRRQVELAFGRSLSHRRVWAAALGLTLTLTLLISGTSMFNQKVNVADGIPTGSQLRGAVQAQDRVLPTAVTLTTAARARATAAARVAASEAAERDNQARPRITVPDAKNPLRPPTKAPLPARVVVSGSMAGLSDAASGLGWASGAYIPGSSPAKIAAFGAWRGAGIDVVTDWSARQSWDDIINPTWLYNSWKGTPYTKVFGVAPIPEGDAGATMAGCAAGSYNDKWTQFGRNIKAAGLDGQTVIRLGWEFNGNWYKWQASNPSQFAACWRQIVTTVRQVAPKLTWDWNVNRGQGSSVADARQAYPGDAYVDIVGVDAYDQWPGARTQADWMVQYAGPFGLKFWADFAKAHHKKLSIPEWGVYPGSSSQGHNGGDNPFYIAKMEGFFKSLGSQLAYESYFNESASYYAGSLYGPTQNPAAAAKYQALVRR